MPNISFNIQAQPGQLQPLINAFKQLEQQVNSTAQAINSAVAAVGQMGGTGFGGGGGGASVLPAAPAASGGVAAALAGGEGGGIADAASWAFGGVKGIFKKGAGAISSFTGSALGLGALSAAGLGYAALSAVRHEASREIALSDIAQRLGRYGALDALTMGGAAARYGFTPEESTAAMGMFGGIAGQRGMRGGQFDQAERLTRLFGLSTEQGMQIFGGAARQGGDPNAAERFAEILANALKRGGAKGLDLEVAQALLGAAKQFSATFGYSGAQYNQVIGTMGVAMGAVMGLGDRYPSLQGAGAMDAIMRLRTGGQQAGGFIQFPDMTQSFAALAAMRAKRDPMEMALQLQMGDPNSPAYWNALAGTGNEILRSGLPDVYKRSQLGRMGIPIAGSGSNFDAARDFLAVITRLQTETPGTKEYKEDLARYEKARGESPAEKIRGAQTELAEQVTRIAKQLIPLYDAILGLMSKLLGPVEGWAKKIDAMGVPDVEALGRKFEAAFQTEATKGIEAMLKQLGEDLLKELVHDPSEEGIPGRKPLTTGEKITAGVVSGGVTVLVAGLTGSKVGGALAGAAANRAITGKISEEDVTVAAETAMYTTPSGEQVGTFKEKMAEKALVDQAIAAGRKARPGEDLGVIIGPTTVTVTYGHGANVDWKRELPRGTAARMDIHPPGSPGTSPLGPAAPLH